MRLTENVKFIIKRLADHGFRADVVGGPVRDYILGNIPDDYDITTSATPEQTKAVFSDLRTVDTGIKHGTVTLMLDGAPYEITTYRIDGEYKDSRHPETVSFTTLIEEDLSRRDFTMNAIAYNPKDGITDPYFGEKDIKNKLIRTVGDPIKRFSEDALRILRGMRFSARLGFDIDPPTAAAMHGLKELLLNVSAERIYTEWQKLLSGDFALKVLSEFSDVVEVFLSEIAGVTVEDSEAFVKADYMTRLVALFYNARQESFAFEKAMRRLKTDTHTRELGAAALNCVFAFNTADKKGIGRLLNAVGEQAAKLTLSVERLLGKGSLEAGELLCEFIEAGEPYSVCHLKVNGNDLKALGAHGTGIGEILERLTAEVIDGEVENDRDAQLLRAKSLLTK